MNLASLRRQLRNLMASGGVLLGSARMAPGCCPPMAEPTARDQTIDPRGLFATAVADCRANDLACTKLCTQVFFTGALPEDTSILSCFLRDRTPTESVVHVDYVVYQECSAGRRPPGLCTPRAAPGGDDVGRWLAAAAHLEAASVPAFVLLARDLLIHGAPPALFQAALAAADDEVRHAAIMGALARARGATVAAVEIEPTGVRDLAAIAIDNAIEGCVREAFAAACAAHQARAALDPSLRTALAAIAIDEARHAALAVALDAWLSTRLGVTTRRLRAHARADAFEQLWSATDAPPAASDLLGLPSPRRARALLSSLRA